MTTQPQPIKSIDRLVGDYLDLAERIEALTEQQATIKHQLRDLGVGEHPTTLGVTVKVTQPSRRFNLARAWNLLTPDQQTVCASPDARKVKAQLAPVIVESCMDAGTGDPVVSIK